jgi:hypothetical protein
MVMKKCSVCGYEAVDEVIFCGKCGTRFAERKCPRCGIIFNNDLSFCPNCGAKNDSTLVDVNQAASASSIEKKKKIISIASIVVLFVSLFFVLMSLFGNWISTHILNSLGDLTSFNLYDILFESLDVESVKTNIFSSLSTFINLTKNISDYGESAPMTIATIGIPLLVTFVIQIGVLAIFLLATIKSIYLVVNKKPFSSFVIKSGIALIVLYSIQIILIGNPGGMLVVGLLFSLALVVTFKVFNYLTLNKKPKFVTMIPNLVGSVFLVLGAILIVSFSNLSIRISDYEDTIKVSMDGILKYLLVMIGTNELPLGGGQDLQNAIALNVVTLSVFVIIIPLFCIYISKRLGGIFDKVKTSTKALGWVLVGFLLVFSITSRLLFKVNLGEDVMTGESVKVRYGSAIVILVFFVITQVLDLIKINTNPTLVSPSIGVSN